METTTSERVRMTSVRKWGNGYGILLPKAFIDTLDLKSAEVQTALRGSSIVLTKAHDQKKTKMTLKEMIRGMRADDRHELIDFGSPRGKEIW